MLILCKEIVIPAGGYEITTQPIPILLDTDIGTDVDDCYALILAAVSPEVRLRGVTTVNGRTEIRSAIARQILDHIGKSDIRVISGYGEAITSNVSRGWMGHEGDGMRLSDLPVKTENPNDAVDFMDQCIREGSEAGDPVTLVTIGPLTNIARFVQTHPDSAKLVREVVCMASCYGGPAIENAQSEHNVACDPDAFEIVLQSGIPIRLVGLNVTRQTSMSLYHLADLASYGGRLISDLSAMHQIWLKVTRRTSSPMHDPLAVAAVLHPEWFTWIPVTASLHPKRRLEGAAIFEPCEPEQVTGVSIARFVDAGSFHKLFFDRILEAVRANAKQGTGTQKSNQVGNKHLEEVTDV